MLFLLPFVPTAAVAPLQPKGTLVSGQFCSDLHDCHKWGWWQSVQKRFPSRWQRFMIKWLLSLIAPSFWDKKIEFLGHITSNTCSMKSWCYRAVQIKDGLKRRLTAPLSILKSKIIHRFKASCALNATQIFSKMCLIFSICGILFKNSLGIFKNFFLSAFFSCRESLIA